MVELGNNYSELHLSEEHIYQNRRADFYGSLTLVKIEINKNEQRQRLL